MSKRMKAYRSDLKLLGECTPSTRKAVFKNCDKDLINAISEAVYSVLDRRVPIQPKQLARLKKDQPILRQIATKRKTVAQKRRLLSSQRGGNIISFLINAIKQLF